MSKKIIVFGASSSKNSINKQLAAYTANLIEKASINLLDLNEYEMPIYSIDKENETGIHPLATKFKKEINNADGFIISFAEHNGNISAAYKNIYDWVSRIEKNFWGDKPMLLMATSPGARGGKGVLEIVTSSYNYSNKNKVLNFSLPSFHENFDTKNGITNQKLKSELENQLASFIKAL